MRFGTRHMTQKERTAFANVAGQQAWHAFRTRVEAAADLEAARRVSMEAPAKTEPGHAFYGRLRDFLEAFAIPAQATPPERILYRALLRRLGDAGDIDPARMWALIETLNRF